MRGPDWLAARPVAHRGLHDRTLGNVENMPGAFLAAIEGNYAIELDLQLSADGEAMVHHDDRLGRLTEGDAPLRSMTAAQLRQVAFKDTTERMISLAEVLAMVVGRVPLFIEVKSQFDGDRKLVVRLAEVIATYSGPAAVMSFDPDQVLAMRERIPARPRGIIAQRTYDDSYWSWLTQRQRDDMLYLRHGFQTQPHFINFKGQQLPASAPWIARNVLGCPLLAWTVRTAEQRAHAARYADQIVFEGFRP